MRFSTLILFVCAIRLVGQSTAPQQTETVQELVSRLTPPQKAVYDEAAQAFGAMRFPESLTAFKKLLEQLPGDPVLSKFTAEAALNTDGSSSYALTLLKPVAAADANDWQAAALLTRACAETGDSSCRDAGMAHMLELHQKGVIPGNITQYIIERVAVGDNTLVIWTSTVPWGRYKVYDLAQVIDKNKTTVLRLTLESNDIDQVQFANEHPKEAAAGVRRFSYDGYSPGPVNANGQPTQSHSTYEMFDGQPSYTAVREKFITIVKGQQKALTRHSYPVAQ